MKLRLTRIAFLILLGVLIVGGWLSNPARTFAALACTVDSVEPASIDVSTDNVVLIGGTGFNAGIGPDGTTAKVIFDGAVVINGTVKNDTTIRVFVPQGALGSYGDAGHTYVVQVGNGADTCTGGATLNVNPVVLPSTLTPMPTSYVRPLVVVLNYGPSSSPLAPGQTFDVEVNLINTGQLTASNVVVVFFPGDFEPRITGGIRSEGSLVPGGTTKIIQTLTAKPDLASGLGLLDIEIRYTDEFGTAYTDKARITLDIKAASGGSGPAATRTPTPGPLNRPQFIISGYRTDVDVLKPGTIFHLIVDIQNKGVVPAKGVSMIVGGGSQSSGSSSGTQEPGGGGVSGGSGEFTNFAPINSSNVQFLGDVPAGGNLQATQALIVNSTTQPGAYSMKISFVYNDEKGAPYTDDQVITLLVLKPPKIDVSFYRPPDPLSVGQPGMLPLQIVNLGNASVILGMMTVTSDGADLNNNTLLIGNVDPGFPITLDTEATPYATGPLTIKVTVEYTDDFNNQQTIEKTLTVDVIDAPIIEPGQEGPGGLDGGFPIAQPTAPETFWDVIVRFFRGLLGLGSERVQPGGGIGVPTEPGFEEPPPDGGGNQPGVPIPIKPGKG